MIKDFPKFDCLITGEKEGYDSEAEVYFGKELQIASIFSVLQNYHTEWKENYLKIIKILDKMDDYIVNGKDLPVNIIYLIDNARQIAEKCNTK